MIGNTLGFFICGMAALARKWRLVWDSYDNGLHRRGRSGHGFYDLPIDDEK